MFSIIIPYYNKARYIKRCVDSVLGQTFSEFEIIIVDDGSSDNGLEFLMLENHDQIRIIAQQNQGVSQARNTGIRNAVHRYIAFLDADDCWHPAYLEKIREVIFRETDATIIGTHYARSTDFLNTRSNQLDYFGFDDYFKEAIHNTYFTASSTVIDAEFFKQNPGFNPQLKAGEDSDLWFRAVQSGGSALYIKNTLAYYSDEDQNQTTKNRQMLQHTLVGNINRLYQRQQGNTSFERFISKYVYFNLYPYYFDKQSRKAAKEILRQNAHFLFWMHLLYALPFSVGEKNGRSYLKFLNRYIYR